MIAVLAVGPAFVRSLLSDVVPTPVNTQGPGEPVTRPPTAASTEPPADPGQPEGVPARDWPAIAPPNSTEPHWVTLQQSELYEATVPEIADCPVPDFAETLTELEEQATGQMRCLQAAWKPVLAGLGYSSADIPIYFYSGDGADSPCGRVEGAPAFYCSAQGGAIYFGESTLNGTSWHPFGVKDMAGHEYGHHLQAEAGFFLAEYETGGGNESARRLELQATCFSYAMLARDSSFELSRDVYDTFEPYLRSTIEDGIHGSHESLAYWGLRGLYSPQLGNCNTWTAPSDDVD